MEGPNVSRDRDRLAALTSHETHLVLVQERNANIRANVVYERLDARGRGRVQVVAELPLLYAHGRRPNPPEVQFPVANRERAGSTTRRARQSKLEQTPYLQSLPVYHYAQTN